MSGANRRTRRLRRGAVLLGLALGPPALLAGVLAVRGTWADERPRLPERVEEGAVCHVCESPGQGKHVRCAMLMPFALEEVWAAITDYEHLGDVCPCLEFREVQREPDGTCRVRAAASSGLPETVPFALEVRHEQNLFQYVSTWDQPSGDVTVNRGGWTLTARGPSLTLVELAVEVQMNHVPTFVLRNINLRRVAETVRGVEQRLRTGAPPEKW
jgi:hypothetical protein